MPVKKLRYLLMIALLAMALGLVACGSDDDGSSDDSSGSGGTIEKNAANADTPTLTVGSKRSTHRLWRPRATTSTPTSTSVPRRSPWPP